MEASVIVTRRWQQQVLQPIVTWLVRVSLLLIGMASSCTFIAENDLDISGGGFAVNVYYNPSLVRSGSLATYTSVTNAVWRYKAWSVYSLPL